MDRIQQLYSELASMLSRTMSRRPSLGPGGVPNNIGVNLKRERPDDNDIMGHKRRDTGEGKSVSNGMMPPPSHPLQDPLSNGITSSSTVSIPPQMPMDAMPGLNSPLSGQGIGGSSPLSNMGLSEAQMRERRMAAMHARQQPPGMPSTPQGPPGGRHMSPPSSSGLTPSNPQMSPTSGGVNGPPNSMGGPGAGSSNGGGGGGGLSLQQIQQQAFAILQTNPPHPIVQYAARVMPNFPSLSLQDQAKRIMQVNIVTFFLRLLITYELYS